ncbi:MAG: VWA domain-containing protein [Saprospiraceae bacterium]
MFRFEDISYIYWLPLILVLVVFVYLIYMWRAKKKALFGDKDLLKRLMPDSNNLRFWIKNVLVLLGFMFLIIAAANPQWGTKKESVKTQSADIFIAFDISQSMMAQDISPSRIERAKRFVEKLIQNLKGDRVGLIFFAGDAYLQMPLTNDYAAALVSIKSANPNMAGTQGTAIDEAINMAMKAYEEDVKHQRALIIISDGEDHDQDAIDKAKSGAENGLVIYTVGVGTEKGGYVPYVNRGRSEFKKDETGAPVMSKLNIPNLQEIARVGGGEFYLVNQGEDAIINLRSKMDRLQKREIEQKSFSEHNSYFQWFILIGLLAFLIDWIMPNGLRKWF